MSCIYLSHHIITMAPQWFAGAVTFTFVLPRIEPTHPA